MTKTSYNPSGRDLQIFALHMAGRKGPEIAALLGVTQATVYNTLNSDFFIEQRKQIIQGALKQITNGTHAYSPLTVARANASRMMALNVQIAETGKSETNRLRAIHDILDRSMGKATQRVVVDDLDSLIERMSEDELAAYSEKGELPSWATGEHASLPGNPTEDQETVH